MTFSAASVILRNCSYIQLISNGALVNYLCSAIKEVAHTMKVHAWQAVYCRWTGVYYKARCSIYHAYWQGFQFVV